MSSSALSLEATTIQIAEEIKVRASIEVTFAALLDQLGPYNETEVNKPMPMKLETWPGGRWYRDLGDNNAITGERCRRSRGRRCWKFAGHFLCPIR